MHWLRERSRLARHRRKHSIAAVRLLQSRGPSTVAKPQTGPPVSSRRGLLWCGRFGSAVPGSDFAKQFQPPTRPDPFQRELLLPSEGNENAEQNRTRVVPRKDFSLTDVLRRSNDDG